MKITQIAPRLKMFPPPVAGARESVVTLLINALVTRTRDDEIYLDLFR
jgi:hypothetical protein